MNPRLPINDLRPLRAITAQPRPTAARVPA